MSLLVDTSAWLALEDLSDQYHRKAVEIAQNLKQQKESLIITEYIFLETVTLIRMRIDHRAATLFGDRVLQSQLVEFVEIDQGLHQKAWQLFKKYYDKEFSFVDCTSFVLIQERGHSKVFSFDHHFTQMGFERIQAN